MLRLATFPTWDGGGGASSNTIESLSLSLSVLLSTYVGVWPFDPASSSIRWEGAREVIMLSKSPLPPPSPGATSFAALSRTHPRSLGSTSSIIDSRTGPTFSTQLFTKMCSRNRFGKIIA